VLFCYSSSHQTTDFDTLEELGRGAAKVREHLAGSPDVAGSVVLSTCNRFEIYLEVAQAGDGIIAAGEAISKATRMSESTKRKAGVMLQGPAAVEHVIAVASGLESVVVGEGEIAGQVRRALETARARKTVTRSLERAFEQASRTSRGVKNHTGLSAAGRSVVSLALELAESRVTDWARTRVLLVGTGRYAGASLAALRARGVRHVEVFSRSGRAADFAKKHSIQAVPEGDLVGALATSDVVITCTLVRNVVLDARTVAEACAIPGALQRRLIVDLGLPRNVDPDVTGVAQTELLDLETIGKHAPLPELQATRQAQALVEQAVSDYRLANAEDAVTPALVALRQHVFDVLDGEIAWSRRRGDFSPATEAALRHLAGVLLHTPSIRARELARRGHADEFAHGIDALFGIKPDRLCPVTDVAVARQTRDETTTVVTPTKDAAPSVGSADTEAS
jgi:glutamyl-tRNA reductase